MNINKKFIYLGMLVIFCIAFLIKEIFAQEFTADGAPDGMEMRVVGQTKILVPQGAKVDQKGAVYTVEPVDKYMARILWQMKQEMQEQVKEQKMQNVQLQEQIKTLKEELNILTVRIEEFETKIQPPEQAKVKEAAKTEQ
ncbi:MAG: hypothetical protein ABIG64_06975 [Candidatus Omnitrophota bacterium]